LILYGAEIKVELESPSSIPTRKAFVFVPFQDASVDNLSPDPSRTYVGDGGEGNPPAKRAKIGTDNGTVTATATATATATTTRSRNATSASRNHRNHSVVWSPFLLLAILVVLNTSTSTNPRTSSTPDSNLVSNVFGIRSFSVLSAAAAEVEVEVEEDREAEVDQELDREEKNDEDDLDELTDDFYEPEEEEEDTDTIDTNNSDTNSNKKNNSNNDANEDEDTPFVCGVYLAHSTLPGTGIGMYAGPKGYKKGELITKTLGDHLIPLVDVKETHGDTGLLDSDSNDRYFLWDQYTWSARAFGINVEHVAMHETALASAGFGAAANSFMDFVNVEEGNVKFGLMDSDGEYDADSESESDHNNYNVHRSKDPGAGAFSLYHSREATARKRIEPHAEFFVSYGDAWFLDRAWRLGTIPVSGDHKEAELLWKRYDRNFLGGRERTRKWKQQQRKLEEGDGENETEEASLPDNTDGNDNVDTNTNTNTNDDGLVSIYREFWHTIVAPLGKVWDESRVFASLPRDPYSKEYDEMLLPPPPATKNTSTTTTQSTTKRTARSTSTSYVKVKQKTMKRSHEWIEEHGVCADAVRIGRSTLPNQQAGHGAFSNTVFEPGEVVLAAPLIHIPHRDILDTYYKNEHYYNEEEDDDEDDGDKDEDENIDYDDLHDRHMAKYRNDIGYVKTGSQLLLNYVFGHKDSTLLLSPYGPGVQLVNHNQTLANLKLQWASPERSNHHPHLLQKSVDDLCHGHSLGSVLALELVATRVIRKDDELFLDYGDDWEKAWNEHVSNWQPVRKSRAYVSATDLNTRPEHLGEPLPNVYTRLERQQAFPPTVVLMVSNAWRHDEYRKEHGDDAITDHVMWNDFLYEPVEIVFRSGTRDVGTSDGGGSSSSGSTADDLDPSLYTVVVHVRVEDGDEESGDDEDDDKPAYRRVTLTGIPRRAFLFEDLSYTQDLFLPNAFRHPIGIPDDIFPEAWKNVDSANQDDDIDYDPNKGRFPSNYKGYAAFSAYTKAQEKLKAEKDPNNLPDAL